MVSKQHPCQEASFTPPVAVVGNVLLSPPVPRPLLTRKPDPFQRPKGAALPGALGKGPGQESPSFPGDCGRWCAVTRGDLTPSSRVPRSPEVTTRPRAAPAEEGWLEPEPDSVDRTSEVRGWKSSMASLLSSIGSSGHPSPAPGPLNSSSPRTRAAGTQSVVLSGWPWTFPETLTCSGPTRGCGVRRGGGFGVLGLDKASRRPMPPAPPKSENRRASASYSRLQQTLQGEARTASISGPADLFLRVISGHGPPGWAVAWL